jgi:flavin-dependent thymidylate synthase
MEVHERHRNDSGEHEVTKEVQKWADRAMYLAPPIEAGGPKVTVLSANSDPLGEIAAATMTYEGKFPATLADVSDEQRQFYLNDVFKARRWAPLEFVNFHFLIEGVTRTFTHQMVRQRTAVYAQESMRFAVKEQVPVSLPASLADTMPWEVWWDKCGSELFPILVHELNDEQRKLIDSYAANQASPQQLWRREWDEWMKDSESSYNALIDAGMPAEDARGGLPNSTLTRIHYHTNLRNLYEHAGNRLCTQAQHEWKVVWKQILSALVEYGKTRAYDTYEPSAQAVNMRNGRVAADGRIVYACDSDWQFDALSKVFKPICYQTGKCEFMSSADRFCAIRDRVELNHKIGRRSDEWHEPVTAGPYHVAPIQDEEWMENHAAARVSQ